MKKKGVTNEDIVRLISGLATKKDLEGFTTNKDLEGLATKEDIKSLATKKDLEGFATNKDIESLATKKDLEGLATKEDLAVVKSDVENLAVATAKGFADVDRRFERHEGMFRLVDTRLTNIEDDIRDMKTSLKSVSRLASVHDFEIQSLDTRMTGLESKHA